MFRYKSLSVSSLMNFDLLQRRLHLIQLQLLLRLNHLLIGEGGGKGCRKQNSSRQLTSTHQRYNIASNHMNQYLISIHASPVFHLKSYNSNSFIHLNLRNYGTDYTLHQKHLLEPSLADNEVQPISDSIRIDQYDADHAFLATIKVNREMLHSDVRSCRHIEIDIDGSNMEYEAGDHIGIYPANDSDLVEKLGKLCDANLDANISPNDSESRLQTFRTALTHHIEIATAAQLQVLKALEEYCTDEADRRFLNLISSATPEGNDLYQSWVLQAQRNIVHVLEDIKSCRPPIASICKILPRLQPRYYSISSSSRLHPTVVHMTVVLVKYETKTGRIKKGVATAFLATKNPEETSIDAPQVPVFIRKSQFHLPECVETPIIMIGTGTGLAPFLGFIQERNHCRENGATIGQTILYFGARKQSEDFIYEKELNSYMENGSLRLRTAFSRDQPEKMYVTHLMQEDADLIWQVIANMGHIYVCGDARHMAHDVRSILMNIIQTKGNMDKPSAEVYLKSMESQRRYSADVWS